MTDVHTPAVRSKNMKAIRSKDTRPEMIVRRALRAAGIGYRLHLRDLPGTPDIVLRKYQTVIFVNSCFWHQHSGCPKAVIPKTNKEFWENKLRSNVARDSRNIAALEAAGWQCLVWWECEKDPARLIRQLLALRHA
jgi:DNA mismatch endonuclease (patch repair protein)